MVNKDISVILPVYNEEENIKGCLDSLMKQTYPLEIIIIDDGSTDRTIEIVSKYPVKILRQNHRGHGPACNYGASKAKGDILVFIDADQILDKYFVEKLIEPILKGEAIGTINDDEHIANIDNIWSKCWNIGEGLPPVANVSRRTVEEKEIYVFRALLKKEFLRVNGFEEKVGYSDDQIGIKLGVKSKPVKEAIAYHKNPSSLKAIYAQSVWIGKGTSREKPFINIIAHLAPISLIRAIPKTIKYKIPEYIIFKIVFDFGLIVGIIKGIATKDYSK